LQRIPQPRPDASAAQSKEEKMRLSKSGKAMLCAALAGSALLDAGGRHEARAAAGGGSSLPMQLDLAFGVEAMSGESKYAIGGRAVRADGQQSSEIFPMSELEWPLDIWLARLDAGWTLSPSWRINGALKVSLDGPGGRIIDRDWLTDSMPWQVDVYSESDVSSFDALIADLNLEWTFWQQGLWSAYAGAGWQHQNFQYDGALVFQNSPSGMQGFNYKGNGVKGVSYELNCSMPYLLLGSEYQLTPQLRLAGSLAFAPLIGADDETVLPLRRKAALGDMDGSAWLFDLAGMYYLAPQWFLEAGLHYVKIDADGEQRQSENGQPLGIIELEASSRQTSGYLSVGRSF
jgi:hypothetical protein